MGVLGVKTPEKSRCPALFTAGHLFWALIMAEKEGFEPSQVMRLYQFSKLTPSAAWYFSSF